MPALSAPAKKATEVVQHWKQEISKIPGASSVVLPNPTGGPPIPITQQLDLLLLNIELANGAVESLLPCFPKILKATNLKNTLEAIACLLDGGATADDPPWIKDKKLNDPPLPPESEPVSRVRDIPDICRPPEVLYPDTPDNTGDNNPSITVRIIPPHQKRLPIVLPPRRLLKDELGQQSGTATEKSKVTTIQQATSTRAWGAILHQPIDDGTAKIYVCDDADWVAQFEERQKNLAQEFLAYLLENLILDAIATATEIGIAALRRRAITRTFLLRKGVLFLSRKLSVQGVLTTVILFGVQEIGEWLARQSDQRLTGISDIRSTIPTNVEVIDCSQPVQEQQEPELNLDVCNLCTEIEKLNRDECFVPIRNFRQDDFAGIGYKTQLQIVFDNNEGQPTKHLSIPAPKEDLTAQEIANVVGPSREFGDTKYEADCTPYGYLRYHGPANQEEAVKDWFEALMTLSTGSIKPGTFRSSYRERPYTKGTFKTARAYVFLWTPGEAEPTCKRFALKPLFS